MSIKIKILAIVAFLIALNLAIAGVAFYVIFKQNEGLAEGERIFEHVIQIMGLNAAIEEQAVNIRDVVLLTANEDKVAAKAKMDAASRNTIDPTIKKFAPFGEGEASAWAQFQESWEKHEALMAQVYEDSLKNTGNLAKDLSITYNTRYWLQYEPSFQRIAELTRPRLNEPEVLEIGLAAVDGIDALKSLLLYEKLALLTVSGEER